MGYCGPFLLWALSIPPIMAQEIWKVSCTFATADDVIRRKIEQESRERRGGEERGRVLIVPVSTKPYVFNHINKELEWCEFHQDHGHNTEACIDLMQEIEECIQHGMLKQYATNRFLCGRDDLRSHNWGPPQHSDHHPHYQWEYRSRFNQVHHNEQALPRPHSTIAQFFTPKILSPPLLELVSNIIHVILGWLPKIVSQAYLKVEVWCSLEEPQHKWFWRDEIITFSEANTMPNRMPH